MEKSDLTIEWVKLDDIKPNSENPNTHSQKQIKHLQKILKYYGWRQPLIVSENSGLLVCGHARLVAAKDLGLTWAPVSYQKFKDYDTEYGFMVADNEIARQSKSDYSLINTKLADFDPDFDVDLFGIPDFEVEPLDRKEKSPKICPHCNKVIG